MSDRARGAAFGALAVLAAVAAAGGVAACGQSASPDAIAARCAPHRERELACADAETKRALTLVGDMCQKALNGKNPQVFGPTAQRRMALDLACAVAHQDCAAYTACKSAEGEPAPVPVPTLPR